MLFTSAPDKLVYHLTDEQLTIVGREMTVINHSTSPIDLHHERKVFDINTTIIEPLRTLRPAFADKPDSYK